MNRRPAVWGVLAGSALLLTGCAVGGDDPQADGEPIPRAALAEQAEVAALNRPDEQEGAPGTAELERRPGPDGDAAGRPGPRSSKADGSSGPSGAQSAPQAPPPPSGSSGEHPSTRDWPVLVRVDDAADDHGDGPGYADLREVELRESGGRLAVSVKVGEVVPGRLVAREVQGVGIDVFRSRSDESDYQVFLDGGVDGWRAFLQTPHGFVDFPGTFAVTGPTLEVVMPWSALGGRSGGEVSVFADWSSGVGRLSTDGTRRAPLPE